MNLSATVSPAIPLVAQATQTATQASTQTATPGVPASQPAGRAPSFMDFFAGPTAPLLLVVIVFYIFVIRSKRNQDRKVKEAREAMKKGDEIQTIGGILGKIVEVRDNKVLVKVDETSNTKIWFSRAAIQRVITEEKAEAAK